MYDKIMESCRFLINNYPGAQDCKNYLNSRLNEESQELFQFGFYPDLHYISVLTSLIGESELKENNLLYSSKLGDSSYFEDYPLIMPFKNQYGETVGLIGRTLLSETEYKAKKISKYKNTIFKKGNYLFGLYENKSHILNQDSVFIVEGQFDVIKAVEKGFKNIVALGSSNMTSYQFSVISRYTNNIFLLLDNDEAGEKGRKRIGDKFGKLANIRNFYLPTMSKDLDDYLSMNSYESLSLTPRD